MLSMMLLIELALLLATLLLTEDSLLTCELNVWLVAPATACCPSPTFSVAFNASLACASRVIFLSLYFGSVVITYSGYPPSPTIDGVVAIPPLANIGICGISRLNALPPTIGTQSGMVKPTPLILSITLFTIPMTAFNGTLTIPASPSNTLENMDLTLSHAPFQLPANTLLTKSMRPENTFLTLSITGRIESNTLCRTAPSAGNLSLILPMTFSHIPTMLSNRLLRNSKAFPAMFLMFSNAPAQLPANTLLTKSATFCMTLDMIPILSDMNVISPSIIGITTSMTFSITGTIQSMTFSIIGAMAVIASSIAGKIFSMTFCTIGIILFTTCTTLSTSFLTMGNSFFPMLATVLSTLMITGSRDFIHPIALVIMSLIGISFSVSITPYTIFSSVGSMAVTTSMAFDTPSVIFGIKAGIPFPTLPIILARASMPFSAIGMSALRLSKTLLARGASDTFILFFITCIFSVQLMVSNATPCIVSLLLDSSFANAPTASFPLLIASTITVASPPKISEAMDRASVSELALCIRWKYSSNTLFASLPSEASVSIAPFKPPRIPPRSAPSLYMFPMSAVDDSKSYPSALKVAPNSEVLSASSSNPMPVDWLTLKR